MSDIVSVLSGAAVVQDIVLRRKESRDERNQSESKYNNWRTRAGKKIIGRTEFMKIKKNFLKYTNKRLTF